MELTINTKTNLNDTNLTSLINKNIQVGKVKGYNELIPAYKDMNAKEQFSIRKKFQKVYSIPVNSLMSGNGTIETKKCKEFNNSILKVSETKGIFLLKNASETALFVCVDLIEVFPVVQPVQPVASEQVQSKSKK